tara:strand:- start:457 stop:1002 length:546 start_codon:yes stop_codon:yes gene_type:complete
MFKKFTYDDNVGQSNSLKNSAMRGILAAIVEQYPNLAEAAEKLLPKKGLTVGKLTGTPDSVQLLMVNNEVMFFQRKGEPWFPTLRLVHKYPAMMNKMQVDRGAIKFVLSGANIMCPGFTSKGGDLPVNLEEGEPVAIYAEGKEHCMALGLTLMSTADIKSLNKGIAVENIHYLLDGLYVGE